MCRALTYLGQPILLDELLYRPDSSLVKQTYDPKMLHMLNLAGFGMAAWDPDSYAPQIPFLYKTTSLPVFDRNLKGLSLKLRPSCVLAHVRGVAYDTRVQIGEQYLHPFHFDQCRLVLAHNGDLARFSEMMFDLLPHLRSEIARQIRGNTDSEWIYALILSQLDDPTREAGALEMIRAVEKALKIIRVLRDRHGISVSSSVNLFLCTGDELLATRFTFDFGCYNPARLHEANLSYLSLWYTWGTNYGCHDGEWKMVGGSAHPDSILVASEPLSRDISSWFEVPEYSILYVKRRDGGLKIQTTELDV